LPDTSSGDPWVNLVLSVIPESRLGIGDRELEGGLNPSLLIVDLKSGIKSFPEEGIINPSYVPSGFLVYQVGKDPGPLVVRPFDPKAGEFSGPPANLLPEIPWRGQFAGADGSFLYVPALIESISGAQRLFLFNLRDKTVEAIDSGYPGDATVTRPAFSPSGKTIAVQVDHEESTLRFVSEYDLEKKLFSRRTFEDSRRDPDWSADGSYIYFDGYRSQSLGIYKQSIDVTGEEILVVEGHAYNPNLSADGNWLAYGDDNDIWLYELESGIKSVVDSSSGEQHFPEFSPDSRYLAFQTQATGVWEVAVRPILGTAYVPIGYPRSGRPKWAPDGKSIYFSILGDGIYSVPVTTDPFFEVRGDAEKIVSVTGRFITSGWFDISPDGNTLAITGTLVNADTQVAEKTYSTIMWWRNWAQSLSKE